VPTGVQAANGAAGFVTLMAVKGRPGVVESELKFARRPFTGMSQDAGPRDCAGWVVEFRGAAGILVVEVESTDHDDLAAGERKCRVTSTASNKRQRGFPGSSRGIV
jgi:hypothetical protein